MSKYAKVGEQVKIITPKVFIRCGYTLTQTVLMQTRKHEVQELVIKAAKELLGEGYFVWNYEDIPWMVKRKLENAACAAILHKEKFGGPERKIFEEDMPELEDKFGVVTAKQIVRTGIYSKGWGGYSYDGEYDYEPNSLEHVKTHCVYTIDTNPPMKEWHIYGPLGYDGLVKVLAVNCQRECD